MADTLTVQISRADISRYEEVAELDEKQRRIFLGMLCTILGHGGQKKVALFFKASVNTIRTGYAEFTGNTEATKERVRRPGAGRKRADEAQPGLKEAVRKALENNSYGDPERVLFWTTLGLRNLTEIVQKQGFTASYVTVGRIVEELGFSKQQNQKLLQVGKPHPDRGGQFEFIEKMVKEFLDAGDPVISVDCKKKEILGNFKNHGKEYRLKGDARKVFDHDYLLKELGKVAPYGIYVLNDNTGFVNLTKCSDTSEFAVQSIRSWWYQIGRLNFPNSKRVLITCDGGGSNGCRVRLWKMELAALSEETGIEFTVCHFPPGTSKWNKIEHKLFCYISKNWEGKPLVDIETVVKLISSTTTKSGLKVECRIDERCYKTGIKVSDDEIERVKLMPLGAYGQWNYTIAGLNPTAAPNIK